VINNVGSRLVEGGYGGDRGFLERDAGQFEEPEEVFAWCGASVLLSTRYLQKVGKFDNRYFVYYEDTDLSWRGRIAGWRYRYVPTSVVRHIHAATSKEGSRLFGHFVERNRLTTLARNAPWSVLFNACYVYLRDSLVILKRDVVGRMRAGRGPHITGFANRVRAFGGFLKLLPRTLLSRVRQLCRPRRRREIWKRWATPF
jgi:GT2 family glycosyltransferase